LNLSTPSVSPINQTALLSKYLINWAPALSAIFSVVLLSVPPANSQPVAPAAAASKSRLPASSAQAPLSLTVPFSGLGWSTLTPVQQTALKPLASTWTHLSDLQKRKWISLSANFSSLPIADQTKLHARMAQWAALSPKQREQARLNFAEAQKIAPEQKTEKWQAYQALSPEEKQKLATSTRPTPPRTALAPQPVPAGKLSQLTLKKGVGAVEIPATGVSQPGIKASAPRQALPSAPEPAASSDLAKP